MIDLIYTKSCIFFVFTSCAAARSKVGFVLPGEEEEEGDVCQKRELLLLGSCYLDCLSCFELF